MQALRDITRKVWPNAQLMAQDIDEPYHNVRKWLLRGSIPSKYWPKIIRRSARSDAPITAEKLLSLNGRQEGTP